MPVLEGNLAPTLGAGERLPADRNPASVYLNSLAPGSRRTMRHALDTVAELLVPGSDAETFPWPSVRYQHAASVRAKLASRYAPATANKILAALRGVLTHAFALGYMSAEDYQRARRVEAIRGSRLTTGRALTNEEVRPLFAACDRSTPGGIRDAALLGVLCGSGLRRTELVMVDLADLDATTGALRVRGKGGRERLCYVTNGARDALDAWLECRGGEPGPLFLPVTKGGRVVLRRMRDQSVLDIVRRVAQKAHVARFSPHDLRRTYISNLLDLGADLSSVQQLAGHAQVTTTARYDRRGEYARRRAAELLHVPCDSGTYRRRSGAAS